jgi:hypothetical protein
MDRVLIVVDSRLPEVSQSLFKCLSERGFDVVRVCATNRVGPVRSTSGQLIGLNGNEQIVTVKMREYVAAFVTNTIRGADSIVCELNEAGVICIAINQLGLPSVSRLNHARHGIAWSGFSNFIEILLPIVATGSASGQSETRRESCLQ